MNALAFNVLRRLADGAFHSGAALAAAFRVSRGTIWNAVGAIEAAGIEVYKVRGRGYRLGAELSMLGREAVLAHVGRAASRFSLTIVDACASTNTLLLERAQSGGAAGEAIAAEWQTQGRGRLGRPWRAVPCAGVTFSLLWKFERGAAALGGLSLACGVAVLRALASIGAPDLRLKWPNDVLWRGRKVAGILVEMHGDALGPSAVVIGIGSNVRASREVASAVEQPIADLETICGAPVDRNRVLGAALRELAGVLDRFTDEGFAPFRPEWERSHAHQDSRIRVVAPSGTRIEGVARGVDPDGALLVETSAGVQRLHSGEVSVRAAGREQAAA